MATISRVQSSSGVLSRLTGLESRKPRAVKEDGVKTDELVLGPTGKPLYWLGKMGINVPGLGGGEAMVQTEGFGPLRQQAS